MKRRSNPHLEIVPGRLRSANVERDTGKEPRRDYVLTDAAVELIRRMANTLVDPDSTRAWALTGPYGTGKSSFAVYLTDLLCGGHSQQTSAVDLLERSDPSVAAKLVRAIRPSGMLPAVVTARREPITETVARALQHATRGLASHHPNPVPTDPGTLLSRVSDLARDHGLLIVIDEFGKNLEYHASAEGGADDLYFLQELAELAAGRNLPRFCILTMQHAAFADYASRTSSLQRREWGKIQGRFHDYAIGESPTDSAEFIAESIRLVADDGLTASVLSSTSHLAERWADLGLASLLPANPGLFADCYPLHPVVLAALPRLCAQLGQHDRTLAGLLGADEPHTVARFVESADFASADLPWYRLDRVYDYFAAAVRTSAVTLAGGRWLEIESRIAEATDLDDESMRMLKSIALLNIVGEGGPLRASEPVLRYSSGDELRVSRTLSLLEARGLVTYRNHADEYRLWAGSDIDLGARIRTARDAITVEDAADLLALEYAPSAVVAGRHSQETGIFRHFVAVVVNGASRIDPRTNTDGYLLFRLGRTGERPNIDTELPVLVGESSSAHLVTAAALDLLALRDVQQQGDLDAVARREVRERLSLTHADLAATLLQAFSPTSEECRWTLHVGGKHVVMPAAPSLSALVSAACVHSYGGSPEISNEMIGRHQLTSQGAKARRELATALIDRSDLERGGLHGFGPDVAMYQGVLEKLGLHGQDKAGSYGWRLPSTNSTARPVFGALRTMIRESSGGMDVEALQTRVAAPPWGVQAGLFPLLALALMLAEAEDLIVMEDGSFLPRITPEHFERLVKSPSRFRVKYAGAATGLRRGYLTALEEASGLLPVRRSRSRNASLVTLTATLLAPLSDATPFALRTQTLDPTAQAVREALKEARDPEVLLFDALPCAVGAEEIPLDAPESDAVAKELAHTIAAAVKRISELPSVLQARIDSAVAAATGSQTLEEARAALLRQAAGITDLPSDAKLRGVIGLARQRQMDSDDWSRQLALLITDQPPTSWRDETLEAYPRVLAHALGTIRRLHAMQFDPDAQRGDSGILGRLTITGRDGSEDHRILDLPTASREAVDRLIDALLASASSELGGRAADLLLAGLVKRVTAVASLHPDQAGVTV